MRCFVCFEPLDDNDPICDHCKADYRDVNRELMAALQHPPDEHKLVGYVRAELRKFERDKGVLADRLQRLEDALDRFVGDWRYGVD
jgi:hypothetical protein